MFTARLLLRHLFDGPVPATPEFDAERAVKDPVLLPVRDRIRNGDWQAARMVVADAGDDWELRGSRVGLLTGLAMDADGWLYSWLRVTPPDPAAVLIQAAVLNRRAGQARGTDTAANTSAEQFASFSALSEAAAEAGRWAMKLAAPNDPLPWVQVLKTMYADRRALEESFDEVYAEGRRRDPHNFILHLTAVGLRCEKWYGSHEQMFAMARGVAAAAPPGHQSALLPLYAHFEYVLREFAWGGARSARTTRACRGYFRRTEVRQEVDQAIAKWRSGPPPTGNVDTCRQWLAAYYCLVGRRADAKAMFDEIGQYVDPASQWSWFWGGSEYGYLRQWWWANGV